jgi:pimeloyl-ACP methyl ester carboxylesterase
MGFGQASLITHAPRWEIHESALVIPHEEIRITTDDGRKLSAWYVPSRNGAAVLLSHGSGGSRGRLPAHVRMLARHGYGVLALDNPGNGESEGHSNGLGDNAQPGLDAALDYLERRPDVQPGRIAGFGLSLGGEVVLEAASRDRRLAAVVADGAARPVDTMKTTRAGILERALTGLATQSVRAISGMKPSRSLVGMMPGIAPRPVLLVAAGRVPEEPRVARMYQRAGGSAVQVWEVHGAGHTAGRRKHPAEYEQRTVGFLDRAIGRK